MASPDQSLSQPKDNGPLRFIMDDAPKTGAVTKVADGVYWLRMSLPMKGLDHINLYFIRDGEEWVIVDTGLGSKDSMDIWKSVFTGAMEGRTVNRVICTHLHPDHAGLAGWLCRRFDAPLIMTRGEYFLCRLMVADTGKPAPEEGIEFYKHAGLTDEQLEVYKSRFGMFGTAVSPLPQSYERIQDGENLTIDGREWKIIIGSGHSPEHACLYSEELELCLVGDQLLPNISSNVSIWPTEPNGNPLDDWISSCHKLILALPEDTLICPAHGIAFRGAHVRLNKLINHHEQALTRLHEFCHEPKMATEIYSVLFRRKINDSNRLMAVGEGLAHLNCLRGRGIMERELNENGQYLYRSLPVTFG